MHLVKWIRKNMQRIMVFVVVFIMLAFVVGQFGLKMIVGLMGGGSNQLIATYDDGQKIKSQNFMLAKNELAVLQMLMADRLLLAQSQTGIAGPLLAHLLFPESQLSSQIASQMKQAVQRGQLQISLDELNDFFEKRPERPEILWLLLKAETQRAGCILPNESAAQTLRLAIPQMTGNQIDAGRLVSQIISKNNISEEQILRIYADLLSVLSYAGNVMDSQAVTINQVKASLGRSKERIDADFVEIAAKQLIDEDADIPDTQIQGQFDKYNASIAGNPTEDNPFGFGYKFPKRVQLEYMVVLLDDVTKQIAKPTPEALEEYYSRNIDTYKTEEPSDPNDPESEKITRTRSFAEVETQIRRTLENEKTTTQANIIFNEIKDKTETGFETVNFDEASLGQLQKAAGDYEAVGKDVAAKYEVPVATGKTGWLSAETFGQDNLLSTFGLRRGQSHLRLSDMAFAATEEKAARQRIGVPSIRVWENIGPLSGGFYSEEESKYYRAMALVRVTGTKEAQVADKVDATFESHGIVLDPEQPRQDSTFSLKETVKDDILLLNAMAAAKERAEELAVLVEDKGWDDAINAYNDKYAKKDVPQPEEAADEDQEIELTGIKQQLRISQADVELAKRIMLERPDSAQFIRNRLTSNMLTNKLYAMLPDDAESTGTIQTVLAFEPQAVCYVVKEVLRQPATTKDYRDNKAQTALQLNSKDSAGLALVHFNPENILERLGYQSKLEQEPEAQQEAPSAEDKENE